MEANKLHYCTAALLSLNTTVLSQKNKFFKRIWCWWWWCFPNPKLVPLEQFLFSKMRRQEAEGGGWADRS
jgi:hypothetical protein